MGFDLCPGKCLALIPTDKRNKHINRCTNLWSVFVFIALILGLSGGVLMFTSTTEIIHKQFDVIEGHLILLEQMELGESHPQEAIDLIDGLPEEIKDMFLEETGLNIANIKQAYQEGYMTTCEGTTAECDCPGWIDQTFNANVAHDVCTTNDMCVWTDKMPDILSRANEIEGSTLMFELASGNTCNLTDEERAMMDTFANIDMDNLGDFDVGDLSGGGNRRRRMGEVPKPEDINQIRKYADWGGAVLMALGLVGPILTTIGMIFFCCMLKGLADDNETNTEAFCGTLMGCFIFPLLFVAGTALSIVAAIFMNLVCIMLTMPFQVMVMMKNIRGCGVATGCRFEDAADVTAWQDNLATNMKDNLPSIFMNNVWPLMKDAAKVLVPAQLEDALGVTHQGFCDEDGSYLMRDVLLNDNTLCKKWVMAYGFGVASQIIAATFSVFGILIAIYIGYKSCCRNKRGEDAHKVNSDVEMS